MCGKDGLTRAILAKINTALRLAHAADASSEGGEFHPTGIRQ